MREQDIPLLSHQLAFCQDLESRDLALVGGRGCGKTFTLATKLIILAQLQAGFTGAALSPTGPMLAKVLIPELRDTLDRYRIPYKFNGSERRFDITFGQKVSQLYCLSAENIRDGLGMNLAYFGMDEADTMRPEVAEESWNKLSGALRDGDPRYRQKVAVSTPEGFGFMYRHWDAEVAEARIKLLKSNLDPTTKRKLEAVCARKLIRGKTRDNFHLTRDFFDDLEASYPAHYLAAYMEGEFCNMSSGSVYPDYDPILNHTNLTFETLPQAVRTLHIGMDFNVVEAHRHPYGIAAVVGIILSNQLYMIDEIYGCSQTSEVIKKIKTKFPGYNINVYPDATSSGSRTSAAESDRTQLRQAGFTDLSPAGNPRIEDRVNAVNAQILNGKGHRRLLVNKDRCPILSRCLVQQPYDPRTGQPQKDTGWDDPCDSLGYLVNVLYPISRKDAGQLRLAA